MAKLWWLRDAERRRAPGKHPIPGEKQGSRALTIWFPFCGHSSARRITVL
jgi:hypothetical protein